MFFVRRVATSTTGTSGANSPTEGRGGAPGFAYLRSRRKCSPRNFTKPKVHISRKTEERPPQLYKSLSTLRECEGEKERQHTHTHIERQRREESGEKREDRGQRNGDREGRTHGERRERKGAADKRGGAGERKGVLEGISAGKTQYIVVIFSFHSACLGSGGPFF